MSRSLVFLPHGCLFPLIAMLLLSPSTLRASAYGEPYPYVSATHGTKTSERHEWLWWPPQYRLATREVWTWNPPTWLPFLGTYQRETFFDPQMAERYGLYSSGYDEYDYASAPTLCHLWEYGPSARPGSWWEDAALALPGLTQIIGSRWIGDRLDTYSPRHTIKRATPGVDFLPWEGFEYNKSRAYEVIFLLYSFDNPASYIECRKVVRLFPGESQEISPDAPSSDFWYVDGTAVVPRGDLDE